MARKRLPDVAGTGRHYVDRTHGGWLVSHALERYVFPQGRGRLFAAAALAVVLVLAVR